MLAGQSLADIASKTLVRNLRTYGDLFFDVAMHLKANWWIIHAVLDLKFGSGQTATFGQFLGYFGFCGPFMVDVFAAPTGCQCCRSSLWPIGRLLSSGGVPIVRPVGQFRFALAGGRRGGRLAQKPLPKCGRAFQISSNASGSRHDLSCKSQPCLTAAIDVVRAQIRRRGVYRRGRLKVDVLRRVRRAKGCVFVQQCRKDWKPLITRPEQAPTLDRAQVDAVPPAARVKFAESPAFVGEPFLYPALGIAR